MFVDLSIGPIYNEKNAKIFFDPANLFRKHRIDDLATLFDDFAVLFVSMQIDVALKPTICIVILKLQFKWRHGFVSTIIK